jgi:hypothetical protein
MQQAIAASYKTTTTTKPSEQQKDRKTVAAEKPRASPTEERNSGIIITGPITRSRAQKTSPV